MTTETPIPGRGASGSERRWPALHPDGARSPSGKHVLEDIRQERATRCDYGVPGHPVQAADRQDPIAYLGDTYDDGGVPYLDGEIDPVPCGVCGAEGACGYDSEGRALIHATGPDYQ